jgi:UDP-N-acetylglucosamine 2-epimerase (non-hydrolysing)
MGRMKIAIVLGTRPEIIKFSPIIRECARRGVDYAIVHTGQHYSYTMDQVFFEQLDLPSPKHKLEVGSGTHGEQTGTMLMGIESVLVQEKPDVVLVQGDTNTTLAGALAATKLGLTVGHVEAGLRSYDRRMPEETNRICTDHCSDWLFAPTDHARQTLVKEGIPDEKILVTGNTIVDALHQNLEIANRKRSVMEDLTLQPKGYFLATVHRQENVDYQARFSSILNALEQAGRELCVPVVYPVHPRSRKQMAAFGLRPEGLRLIDPVDFLSFLQLQQHAQLVLTDSGGVQEEACVLQVPCLTLRETTERPETVDVGSNVVAGTDTSRILECVRLMVHRDNGWTNPFGDGRAGLRIVDWLDRHD